MSNEAAQRSATARYRVVRVLGNRSPQAYAATRADGALVVLHRFTCNPRLLDREGDLVSAEEMGGILRDAHCLERNWHPNIARVRDVDLDGDVLDVATEMIDGLTLDELSSLARARRERADEPVVSHAVLARIFLDVLAGLSALHSLRDGASSPLRTFHGELCPANVVIGKDGVARLVSVLRPRPVRIGASSEPLGYAAPEVLASETDQDARVDLYSTGVMLWEALTERRLHVTKDPARILQRQREDVVAPPNAPLAEVASRALAFDRALRFRSAHEMAAAVRALAGTVAQGSLVAQLVSDLASDRIRARRLELEPSVSGQHRSTPPLRSDTRMLAPSAPDLEDTPVMPRATDPVTRRGSTSLRIATPSAPDLETSYAPRPLPARRAAPGSSSIVPRPAPSSRVIPHVPAVALPFDDDLPGPRQSMVESDELQELALGALPGPRSSHSLLDDYAALADAIDDTPVRAKPPAPRSTAAPSVSVAVPPPLPAPIARPSVHAASTRTPFVVDLPPADRSRSIPVGPRGVRLAVIGLVAAVVLLTILAFVLASRSPSTEIPPSSTDRAHSTSTTSPATTIPAKR